MAKAKSARVEAGEAAYSKADAAYGRVKEARKLLLAAVLADPVRDYTLEPVWRALARVEGELGAIIDRLGDEIEATEEGERARGDRFATEPTN